MAARTSGGTVDRLRPIGDGGRVIAVVAGAKDGADTYSMGALAVDLGSEFDRSLAPIVSLRASTSPAEASADPAAVLARAQGAADAGRFDLAAMLLESVRPIPSARIDLLLRALFVEGWLAIAEGRLDDALERLMRANTVAGGPEFSDIDRAEALFRLGACRFKRGTNAVALSLLTVSLELAGRCELPSDRLRANILVWRARCWQRQRDWEAARADVERALELADAAGDEHAVAHAMFQASLIAEREGQFLVARCYAEEARRLYAGVDDRLNIARLTNNLGGLLFLLGRVDEATASLERAHALALEIGSDADAAQALSSLAQVHLHSGAHAAAESEALQALELLAHRPDYLDEAGNARLVLGRALLEQERLDEAAAAFAAADDDFARLGSVSHRAAAWIAQGDLAARSGRCEQAAALYRRAAEALQDFHF